jgi:carboxypeptidase family protein
VKKTIAAVAVAASLAASCTSSPQVAEVTGTVVDASNGEPLHGVALSAKGRSTETDRDGAFRLKGVPEGSAVKLSICSHEESVAHVRAIEEPALDLGEIELRPLIYEANVASSLTGRGIRARFKGQVRGKTRANGKATIRGACPDATLRFTAPGYEAAKIKIRGSMDIVLVADPGTTAEYLGDLYSRGRSSDAWDLVHPDVKAYTTERDYIASVRRDALDGYQVISIDVKRFNIIRWTFPACEYSDFGPKTYPRTAAVEAIYHYASPRGGGYTERTVTHWVQTKDGQWRWFANVGCSFLPP